MEIILRLLIFSEPLKWDSFWEFWTKCGGQMFLWPLFYAQSLVFPILLARAACGSFPSAPIFLALWWPFQMPLCSQIRKRPPMTRGWRRQRYRLWNGRPPAPTVESGIRSAFDASSIRWLSTWRKAPTMVKPFSTLEYRQNLIINLV